jgi:DNA-binding transcriptional LysR family regulator
MAKRALAREGGQDPAVGRLDTLGYLLDNSIPIPGTGRRVGLDALIGLIPGVGDIAGVVLSSWIVLQAARLGVGVAVLARMLLNLVVDGVLGAVPLLGDLFDAGWKANDRNLRLLHRALDAPGATRRSSAAVVLLVALLLIGVIVGTVALAWAFVQLVINPGTWTSAV